MVIVGSGPLDIDYSTFINNSDCVVRFNNCKNYGGNSGKKTDILFMNNTGNPFDAPTLRFLIRDKKIEEVLALCPYLANIKQLIFVRPEGGFMKQFVEDYIPTSSMFHKRMLRNGFCFEQGEKLISANGIDRNIVSYLSPELCITTWNKLIHLGESNGVVPSTGILAIEKILSTPAYHDYKKYIVGFTWQGWRGHPWNLERQLIEQYIQDNMLFTL